MSYTPYTGEFTEKILTVEQSWAQEPTGYNRTATAYLPDTPAMSGKLPVVIDLHGFGGKGTKRWKDIGDQIIFVGADGYCPPGEKCSWNVFGEPSKAPDTEFILELISKIGDEIPDADMDNVNIVGTSNGAALTYLLLLSTDSSRPFKRYVVFYDLHSWRYSNISELVFKKEFYFQSHSHVLQSDRCTI